MSDVVDRITEVLRRHTPSDIGFCNARDCHWRWTSKQDHPAHAAERVAAELQLTEEKGWVRTVNGVPQHAIVGWLTVEETSP